MYVRNLILRLVVTAANLLKVIVTYNHAKALAERSPQQRIGLLENGFKVIAVLPADPFFVGAPDAVAT